MRFRTILSLSLLAILASTAALALNLKDVTFKTKDAGKVVFSHNLHISQKGMSNNCKACHNAIFDIKKKVRHTMADMEKGKSCGACHDGKQAFNLKECARCHLVKEITYKVKATGSTRFSHQAHLLVAPDCGSCHPALFAAGPNKRVTMNDMKKGKSCGACHDGKKAFDISDCGKCHPTREITFKSKSAGATPFSHKKHTELRTCDACHTKIYAIGKNRPVSMAEMGKGKSCGACHNGKEAFSIDDCGKCHPVKDLEYRIKGAGNVTFSHNYHLGKYKTCNKCHPRIFAPGDSKPASMTEMEKGRSCGACHDGKAAFTVRENCARCHKVS